MHGFSPVESDRLGDHVKHSTHQHLHQTTLSRGHDHAAVSFAKNRRSSVNGLTTADNIAAISDVSSSEQMIYFTNENVKGNFSIDWNSRLNFAARRENRDHQQRRPDN